MRILELLYEGYPEAQTEFTAASDANTAQAAITAYKDLVNRNQVQGPERNIDHWRKQGWDLFKQMIDTKSQEASKTQVKRSKLAGNSITLQETDDWLIVIPLDKTASCFHGKASSWCTTKPNQSYFEDYFYNKSVTLIYCLNKQTAGMWAIAAHKDTNEIEMFDQKDSSIDSTEFSQQTGLDPRPIVDIALGPVHKPVIQASRDNYINANNETINLIDDDVVKNRLRIEKLLIYTKNEKMSAEYLNELYSVLNHKISDIPEIIQINAIKRVSPLFQYIENPSLKVQKIALEQDGNLLEYIKDPSEELQILAVKHSARAISHIKDPSEEVQIASVTYKSRSISRIANPTEKVQLLAIHFGGGNILVSIKNPSEVAQLAAVQQDGSALEYIDNPNEAMQLAAVTNYGIAIRHIKSPSEAVQLMAVQKSARAFSLIRGAEPSERVRLAAVIAHPVAIQHISYPSEEEQLTAVTKDGSTIQYLIFPSEAVQMAAVTQAGESIKYINKPSERVQIAAVTANWRSLHYINDPSEKVQLTAMRMHDQS